MLQKKGFADVFRVGRCGGLQHRPDLLQQPLHPRNLMDPTFFGVLRDEEEDKEEEEAKEDQTASSMLCLFFLCAFVLFVWTFPYPRSPKTLLTR